MLTFLTFLIGRTADRLLVDYSFKTNEQGKHVLACITHWKSDGLLSYKDIFVLTRVPVFIIFAYTTKKDTHTQEWVQEPAVGRKDL